jgi:hypothetical protein
MIYHDISMENGVYKRTNIWISTGNHGFSHEKLAGVSQVNVPLQPILKKPEINGKIWGYILQPNMADPGISIVGISQRPTAFEDTFEDTSPYLPSVGLVQDGAPHLAFCCLISD